MRPNLLDIAVEEAQRFIAAARKAQGRLAGDRMASITGCAESATAKRASMDLTRALAAMRKP